MPQHFFTVPHCYCLVFSCLLLFMLSIPQSEFRNPQFPDPCFFRAIRAFPPLLPQNFYAILPVNPRPERFWKYAQSAKLKNYKSNKYA
jgi:energy-converting hydrogenase Eha subunit F